MKTPPLGLVAALLAALASLAASTADRLPVDDYVIDHRHSPRAQLRPLPFDAVEWTDDFGN